MQAKTETTLEDDSQLTAAIRIIWEVLRDYIKIYWSTGLNRWDWAKLYIIGEYVNFALRI